MGLILARQVASSVYDGSLLVAVRFDEYQYFTKRAAPRLPVRQEVNEAEGDCRSDTLLPRGTVWYKISSSCIANCRRLVCIGVEKYRKKRRRRDPRTPSALTSGGTRAKWPGMTWI